MLITFLEPTTPAVRASKTFTKRDDGVIEKDNFPNLYRVTTHTKTAENIQQLHYLIKTYAEQGFVLLKGNTNRPLNDERRAGTTDSHAPTQFIVLDIDGMPGITTPEEFIEQCLPPEFENVSYTWHPSSSAGIVEGRGFSAHISFLLAQPIPAPLIKNWLNWLNLTNPTLKSHIKLSKTGVTLLKPLDTSVCQNDKLIYIANPVCIGFADPLEERHFLVEKEEPNIALDVYDIPSLRDLEDAVINELREAKGLKKKVAKYKDELLTNPDPATFIEVKRERGFVYGNLGGKDTSSTAYYFREDNPRILRNFKDDPPVLLRDIDPVYYRRIQNENNRVLAFRDFKTDKYYNGYYDEARNKVTIYPTGSKEKISDFMRSNGLAPPDPMPDWELYFDPTSDKTIDFPSQRLNLYEKSDILAAAENMPQITDCPAPVYRLVKHMCGSCEETTEEFLNWIACVVQYKKKPQTAWVIHGIQGTGKGLFYERVMSRILGPKYCLLKQVKHLDDQFNEWLETALLVVFDETDINDVPNPERTMSTLKNLITEPTQTIRRMRVDPYEAHTYCGFIFYSNMPEVVRLETDDRRFNIAPRQEKKFAYTDTIGRDIDRAVQAFAAYLLNREANEERAKRVIETAAKSAMRNAASTSLDVFFKAIREGDLLYFLNYYNDEPQGNPSTQFNFQNALNNWCKNIKNPTPVTRSELIHAYNYIQGQRGVSPNKFERMLNRYNIQLETVITSSGPTKGIIVNWNIPDEDITLYKLGKA